MWEYRWAEVAAGSAEDAGLTRLGADGWEAVGMTVTGEHFGKTWVKVLFKRPVTVAAPAVIDLTETVQRTF
jgi:hypothetical protein